MEWDNDDNAVVKNTFDKYRFFGVTLPSNEVMSMWNAFGRQYFSQLAFKETVYLPLLRIEYKLILQHDTYRNQLIKFRTDHGVRINWDNEEGFIESMATGIDNLFRKKVEYEETKRRKNKERARRKARERDSDDVAEEADEGAEGAEGAEGEAEDTGKKKKAKEKGSRHKRRLEEILDDDEFKDTTASPPTKKRSSYHPVTEPFRPLAMNSDDDNVNMVCIRNMNNIFCRTSFFLLLNNILFVGYRGCSL